MQSLRSWKIFPLGGGVYAILSAVGFSFKAIFVKMSYAAAPIDSLSLLALRMGLSLPLFLWLMQRGKGTESLTVKGCFHIGVLGLFGYYLSSLFDFIGLQFISSSLERMILFTYPMIVVILQSVIFKKRITFSTAVAIVTCYAGLAIAFAHELVSTGIGRDLIIGSVWVFAGALSFSIYYLGAGAVLKRMSSMRLAGLAGTASASMVLIHYLVAGEFSILLSLPPKVWLIAGIMAIFSTVLPIYWGALAIQKIGVVRAAGVSNLGPVFTGVSAWVVLGESISILQFVGMTLILFGVTRLNRKPAVKSSDQGVADLEAVELGDTSKPR